MKFGNDPKKHIDFSAVTHVAPGKNIPPFLILHVADTALVVYRPDWYDHALVLYRHPLFRVGEVAVFFSVLLGCGLFALSFFSDKSGHDQSVRDATSRQDEHRP